MTTEDLHNFNRFRNAVVRSACCRLVDLSVQRQQEDVGVSRKTDSHIYRPIRPAQIFA